MNLSSLTPRASRALESARQVAREHGHASVGSEHILWGLFQLGSGVHFHMLQRLGVTVDALGLRPAAQVAERGAPTAEPDLGATAVGALTRARAEALALRHSFTGTEHILLALLSESQGGVARLFAAAGVDLEVARVLLLREMSS